MTSAMNELTGYPVRVTRSVAMNLLAITRDEMFAKVVAAHDSQKGLAEKDKLVSKLPGEQRAKYRVSVIAKMLDGGWS
jgi:hypothetical protein